MAGPKWMTYFLGDSEVKKKARWEKEVAEAEKRLRARKREEDLSRALVKRRLKKEAEIREQNQDKRRLVDRGPEHIPLPPSPTPEPDFARPASNRALWDPTVSMEEHTLALANHHARLLPPRSGKNAAAQLRAKLEVELAVNDNLFVADHPLLLLYERARARAVQSGEEDLGDAASLFERRTPAARQEHRLCVVLNPPTTYTDANGTIVQKGFDLPKSAPTVAVQPTQAEPHNPFTTPYPTRTLRANTTDERLLCFRLNQPRTSKPSTPRVDSVLTASLATSAAPEIRLSASLAAGGARCEGLRVGRPAQLARSVLHTPDPAEAIERYFERRKRELGVGVGRRGGGMTLP